jgi:signal transduction histidine kinase
LVTLRFSEFIEQNLESILQDWESFASTCLPAAEGLTSEQLRNGAEYILRAVAADMGTLQSGEAQRRKARGTLPRNSPRLTRAAHAHASDRFSNGFDLEQLVAEYRALRASILELWAEHRQSNGDPTEYEMTRFNEAIDQVLTESVRWYSARLDRARELYIGVLSHDLRDPLGAISVSAQAVLADPQLEQRHRQMLAQVPKSTARMAELVGNLLLLTRARIGSGMPISLAPTDFADVAHRVVEEVSARHPERSIKLDMAGDLRGVWDGGRLAQVLSNLLTNAIKHGAPARPVTVRVRGQADDVIFAVHNYGPSMSQATIRAVTQPLVRGPLLKGESSSSQSLRLGLYIVREIMEAHGGSINVTSTDETEFEVRLPRRTPQGFNLG